MRPDAQSGFLLKGVNQKFVVFFWKKIVKFRPCAKQTDATQACHQKDIVTQYVMTMYGGLGAEPPAAGRFLWFRNINSDDFNAILITFRNFKALRIIKLLKFRSHLNELNSLAPSAPFTSRSSPKYVLNTRISRLNF